MKNSIKIVLLLIVGSLTLVLFQNCGNSEDAAIAAGDIALESELGEAPSAFTEEFADADFQTSAMSTRYITAPAIKWVGAQSTYNGRPTIVIRWYQGNLKGNYRTSANKGRFTKFNIYIGNRYKHTVHCSADYDCEKTFYADASIKKGWNVVSIVGVDSKRKFTTRSANFGFTVK